MRVYCICKVILGCRICYKHRKWIVDRTDLRTFRRDGSGAGGQLAIKLSVCWERGGHLSCCCNINVRCYKLQVIPAEFFLTLPISDCWMSKYWPLHLELDSLLSLWRLKRKKSCECFSYCKFWWAGMNKLDTKVFKCFRFPRTCSQMGESPQPRKTTRKMKGTQKKQ